MKNEFGHGPFVEKKSKYIYAPVEKKYANNRRDPKTMPRARGLPSWLLQQIQNDGGLLDGKAVSSSHEE
jgi:hypothetical protein